MEISHRLYKELFKSSAIGLALNHMDGTFAECNDALLNMTGYTKEELFKLSYWDLTPQTYEAQEMQQLDSIQKTGSYGPYEKEYIHRNGHSVNVLLNGSLVTNDDGEKFIWSTIQNISHIKKEELVLNKAQELAHIGHWNLDLESGELAWSDETFRIFGLQPQAFDATYDAFVSHIHPDDRDKVNKAYTNSIEADRPYQIEHRVVRPDGEVRYVIERCEHTHSETGKITGSIGTVSDITESKRNEDALKEARDKAESANVAKSSFIANMSHELRTPLNAILGFSKAMVSDKSLSYENIHKLEIINRSGKHLLDMINNILDMSKIESGEMKLYQTPFDLIKTIKSITDLMKFQASQKSLSCKFHTQKNLPHFIKTDESKLKQVLLNLISNAIKFTDKGSITLSVSTQAIKSEKNFVLLDIHIEDTGCGIQPNMLEEVFEPFVQNDGIKKVEGGTGLGLSISKKIIELLDGSIQVASELGKGSVFHISFPVEVIDASSMPNLEIEKKAIGLKGNVTKKVLVVDDISSDRILLSLLLKKVGFNVVEAKNGDDAIEIAKLWKPDFIWLNVELGDQKGQEVANFIYDEIKEKRPIIAIMSASILNDDKKVFADLRYDYFIFKSFDNNEILGIMKEALKIEYLYEEEQINVEEEQHSSLDFTTLPDATLDAIFDAARKGSGIKIKKELLKIEKTHPEIYTHITKLATEHDFEKIITELKENNA